MGEAVREMTREELLCKLKKVQKDRDLRMIELADASAELEKVNYQIEECNKEISKIKSERDKAVAQIEHDRAKIGELLNEIDCKRMELPPEEPIGAAAWLINAKRKRKTNSLQKFFHGSEEYEDYDVYSVSDLREIAEHLLAYCKNNESEVGMECS